MAKTVKAVRWYEVNDGDYSEIECHYKGHKVSIASDVYARKWNYSIDDGEPNLGYETKEDAIEDALAEVRLMVQ